jgi:invasion protein IalB
MIESLKSGNALFVAWRSADGQPRLLQFDLQGFSTAWSSIADNG